MRVHKIDELPVMNAKRAIWIEIKKADIDKADTKEPGFCAVARACRRQHHVADVRVHLSRVYVRFRSHGHWLRFETPQNLKTEIVVFDRGGKFSPGEFRLPAPRPSKRASGKRQGTKTNEGVTRKTRRAYHAIRDVRGGPA